MRTHKSQSIVNSPDDESISRGEKKIKMQKTQFQMRKLRNQRWQIRLFAHFWCIAKSRKKIVNARKRQLHTRRAKRTVASRWSGKNEKKKRTEIRQFDIVSFHILILAFVRNA